VARNMPSLSRRLEQVLRVVRELPGQAAKELGVLAQEGHQRQRSPEGNRFAPVQQRQRNTTGLLDPEGHLEYRVVMQGTTPVLGSVHPAAGIIAAGRKNMPARHIIPHSPGEAMAWMIRILRKARGVLRG
jgi:hypothetical protein